MTDETQNTQPASAENTPDTPGAGKLETTGNVVFTPEQQKALDRIVEQRLARQKSALEQKAEKTLNDRVQALEEQTKAATIRALKAEIAADKGLAKGLAERLRGETLEELQADADALLALIPKASPAANPAASKPGVSPANPGGSPTGWTTERARNTSREEFLAMSDEEFKQALKAVSRG